MIHSKENTYISKIKNEGHLRDFDGLAGVPLLFSGSSIPGGKGNISKQDLPFLIPYQLN